MNTTLSHVRSLDRDEQYLRDDLASLPRHLSAIDRLSLRLGLWLLLRGTRRIARARTHDDHARLLAAQRARDARERAAQREQAVRWMRG